MSKPAICSELVDSSCKVLAMGAYQREAARSVGICESTLNNWLSRGGKERRHIAGGGKPRKRESAYLGCLLSIEKAKAVAQVSDLALVNRAATEGAWQAAAWKLERRNPDQWGRNRLDVQAEGRLVVEGGGWLATQLGAGIG